MAPFWPCVKLDPVCVLLMLSTGAVFTVTVSVLLGVFEAPPPATEAVLLIEAGALAATFTVSVRVLELPIPIVVPELLVQLTT